MINLNVIKLKDGEFYELTDIIKNQAGIFFRKSKKYLLEYKLTPRLRELNFNSFSDYIYYLKYPVLNKRELDKLISLITICETYFFRERAQFDYMINDLIPNLVKDGKRNFKIWSAACSTGEEIYSIVILLKENMLLNRYNFEFFASDVNNKALEIAKYGEYKKNSFRGDIDNSIINKYFIVKDNRYKLKDEIRKKVKFYKL
ncbi:MAG: CheR family methyltransferase, partial [Deferribacterota bacterium]|nr:CheR family methyltransferase [Deferribacterota bacterium]